MTNPDSCCDEATLVLSRRRLLAAAGLTAGAAAVTSVFGDTLRNVAYAGAPSATGNVLVVLSLRGAIDGMGVVVPHGDPAYYAKRPVIAIPKANLICADSMFGLHPALAPLAKYWTSGEFAAVTATGMIRPNRSHFSAMEAIEDADPTSTLRQGWVNRLVELGSSADDPLSATFLGSTTAPTLTSGSVDTLAADRLADLTLTGAVPGSDDATWQAHRRSSLGSVWNTIPSSVPARTATMLRAGATSALSITSRLTSTATATYAPANGAVYPTAWPATDLGAALKDTAQLIKSGVGVETVALDYGSWDFHTDYGTLTSGGMARNLTALASALDAFLTDLGTERKRVTVVTISEFGRRLTENSAHGLDHGWGNMMLLFGAGVRGGRYYGTWPTLSTPSSSLVDDDLQVTTDYRDVLADVISSRFPGRSPSALFGSDYTRTTLGLMS
ncbi:DUF1501 domain-containing protein [Nocardioides sp. Kera G14]|uniref:DUF1501 domain-containing protein n=1 Tax=Nocardioides sp. Kera G14 TaxID=2884264 RepID=UPI001D115C9E|nr:DUF1501 domain-containing protein [Nocardioides sp. Kera G14]UDY24967.1 DUF1501 domain-containing protein [Nocardioides sp. Kera G14]